ncbi:hypothetical protein GYMLUDRAFT_47882 [Collybiopsis luxurians FD-317 M1]|uniref:F-box domain-containing protein n=1 Tax=Collybiopsis luxurians FD-317 M1 TaxID=944289 RepID=A0A0D0AXG5_9AGAR|nr:hypothetical protein GYMLUDRAFT_47882 [Collybiopsis luxurians FD-317 M1]
MTVQLPFDIWFKILDYLPSNDSVIRLRTVNRVFLEIARRLLYGKLCINKYEKRTKHLLKGISSCSLGSHVHSLHIQPWTVSSLVSPTSTRRHGPAGRVSSAFDHVCSFFDSDYAVRKAQALLEKRMCKQIKLVTDTVNKLEHVREYTVDWDVEKPYHAQLFTAFLTLLNISPFSQTLTVLTLRVPTDRLACLAPIHLPALEELNVHLTTQSLSERYINDCLDCFSVFVNNLFPTLRSLSVSSTHLSLNLNLSKFFRLLSIAYFPRLRAFALSIPYDGSYLPNETDGIASLHSFILKHSRNLQYLKLSSYPRCSFIRTRPSDPLAKYWIQRTLLTPGLADALVSLNCLELAVRPLRSDLGPFLVFISSVAHQLDSLVLTDDPLTAEEVEMVVDALGTPASGFLRHLSLHLQYLSPATLDILASRLPSLTSLRLTFGDIKSSTPVADGSAYGREVWLSQMEYELNLFHDDLSLRSVQGTYNHWPVSSLVLSACSSYYSQYQYHNHSYYHHRRLYVDGTETGAAARKTLDDLEEVFRKCIPSLAKVCFI